MLLTIHNLPSTTRYVDVKALLKEKCGLSDIIVDNLVNEGKNKKVTVGLASDHDGAFVVRKLNGLFINGQQLYIEDRRRNTDDQPYRPASFEPDHSPMQPVIAPVVPSWNPNTIPYMQPVVQNLAFSGYGGVALATPYMEPQPVSVPAVNPGYSGYQDDPYASGTLPRNQEPDRSRNTRDHPPDSSRRSDRKRRHSPERPASNKRSSRSDNFNRSRKRRDPSPPQKRWSDENRALHESERFSRANRDVEAPNRRRERSPRQTDPQWERNSRWEEPSARPEREQQWGNNDREWEPRAAKDWDDEPQQLREGPRPWDNQPKPQWDNQPQQPWDNQPKPQWDSQPKPQWDNQPKPQWDNQPKPQWDSQPKLQWDNQPKPQWDNQPKPQWDNQPKPQYDNQPKPQWDNQPVPQWDDQPNPQWDNQPAPQWGNQVIPQFGNQTTSQWEVDSRMPVENIRSEQFDHLASNDPPRDDQPRDHGRYNDRRQNEGFNRRTAAPIRKEPENSFKTSDRRARTGDDRPRNRSRSRNDRPGRVWSDNRPVPSRDLSGGRKKPDFGKPKEYPSREFKNQTRTERSAPNVKPRFEAPGTERGDRPHAKETIFEKRSFIKEKTRFPPISGVSGPSAKRPFESNVDINKRQSYRSLINKDLTNRGQATALLAKKVVGASDNAAYIPNSPLDKFIFKQLKMCIKSRIDLLLGEELSTHIDQIVKSYRQKYPVNQDKKLIQQVREKSTKEFVMKPKMLEKDEAGNLNNGVQVKKEKEDTANTEKKEGKSTEQASTANKNETGAVRKILPAGPPNMPKAKPGKPLTDKQVIQQMKLQRKWEYDQEDLYSMDDEHTKALDEEMSKLDELFTAESATPEDEQEAAIFKLITTDGLSDFNKAIRLSIAKRVLKIETGLAIRVFASGKLPRKDAILQYLSQRKIKAAAVRKSVKGNMIMINLANFEDYDALCTNEYDVIDGTPITFKAMHLIGPPPKLNKHQVKALRQKRIDSQIDDPNVADFEEVDFGNGNEDAGNEESALNSDELQAPEDFTEDFTEDLDVPKTKDIEKTADIGNGENIDNTNEDFANDVNIDNLKEEFDEEVNIDNINEEDLEDF